MREILFRGKRVDNGEWVYGYYCETENQAIHKYLIIPDYASICYGIDIIPDTVGQYTGLTDKNGERIFEGDILKLFKSDLYKVYFDRSEASFQMTGFDDTYAFYKCASLCEIVGNKYDNPELRT